MTNINLENKNNDKKTPAGNANAGKTKQPRATVNKSKMQQTSIKSDVAPKILSTTVVENSKTAKNNSEDAKITINVGGSNNTATGIITSTTVETAQEKTKEKKRATTSRSKNVKVGEPANVFTNDASPKKSFKLIVLQFLTFLGFSLGAAGIEISSFSIIILMGSIVVADVISVILSCLFNFTLNRKYTFKSANNIYLGMVLYGVFYLIFTPLGAWFIKALVDTGMNEFLAKFIKMLINFVLDFCFCKFVVFKVKLPKQKQPKELTE